MMCWPKMLVTPLQNPLHQTLIHRDTKPQLAPTPHPISINVPDLRLTPAPQINHHRAGRFPRPF
ncbi:hypothetical protein BJX64DRAFT_206595 [Aspergillus heterothallicus]